MITIAGLFDNTEDARGAVEELIAAGSAREAISLVTPQPAPADPALDNLAVKDAEKGAVVGGLAGLLLGVSELAVPGVGPVLVGGWLAATLIGAGVGAATGGLVGSLLEAGVSHETAGYLAEGVRAGKTLVTVRTEGDSARATEILQRHHALQVQAK
jgi:hypothetical protein